jgi:hypothetical protein
MGFGSGGFRQGRGVPIGIRRGPSDRMILCQLLVRSFGGVRSTRPVLFHGKIGHPTTCPFPLGNWGLSGAGVARLIVFTKGQEWWHGFRDEVRNTLEHWPYKF